MKYGGALVSPKDNSELIMAIHGGKGYLLNILLSKRDLIIPRLNINLGKYSSPLQSLKQHLNMGQWVLVLDCHGIQATIVNTHTPTMCIDVCVFIEPVD